MKDEYKWGFDGITKNGEHLTEIQVARELNPAGQEDVDTKQENDDEG